MRMSICSRMIRAFEGDGGVGTDYERCGGRYCCCECKVEGYHFLRVEFRTSLVCSYYIYYAFRTSGLLVGGLRKENG